MRKFDFTYDEVVSALKDMRINDADGFTSEELAISMDWSPHWARNRLKKMILMGNAEYVGLKTSLRIDGRPCKKPAYRLLDGGNGDQNG